MYPPNVNATPRTSRTACDVFMRLPSLKIPWIFPLLQISDFSDSLGHHHSKDQLQPLSQQLFYRALSPSDQHQSYAHPPFRSYPAKQKVALREQLLIPQHPSTQPPVPAAWHRWNLQQANWVKPRSQESHYLDDSHKRQQARARPPYCPAQSIQAPNALHHAHRHPRLGLVHAIPLDQALAAQTHTPAEPDDYLAELLFHSYRRFP